MGEGIGLWPAGHMLLAKPSASRTLISAPCSHQPPNTCSLLARLLQSNPPTSHAHLGVRVGDGDDLDGDKAARHAVHCFVDRAVRTTTWAVCVCGVWCVYMPCQVRCAVWELQQTHHCWCPAFQRSSALAVRSSQQTQTHPHLSAPPSQIDRQPHQLSHPRRLRGIRWLGVQGEPNNAPATPKSSNAPTHTHATRTPPRKHLPATG